METEATVQYLEIEGGCWALSTGDTRYEPLNLPEDFKSDGLRVRFQAETRPDQMSVCQIGPIVEIQSIERVDD